MMRYSIIIPYGNAVKTIRACLDSVLHAADGIESGCEVICVNGGGDDGTDVLVDEFVAHDPRIVHLADCVRQGPGNARNRGLDIARGEYIVFVDADDRLRFDALSRLSSVDADIITFIGPSGQYDLTSETDRHRLFSPLVGNLLVWNAVWRRETIGDWRFPELFNYEDLVWTAGMFARANRVLSGFVPWYEHDTKILGSASNTYSWRRVRDGFLATKMIRQACSGALVGLGTRLILARKLLMHCWLHIGLVIPRAFIGSITRWRGSQQPTQGKTKLRKTWLVDARTIASQPTGIGMYAKRQLLALMQGEPAARFVLACDVRESEEIRALEAAGAEVKVYGKRVFRSIGILGYFRFLKQLVKTFQPDVFWQPNNVQPFRPVGVERVIVSIHDAFGIGPISLRHLLWHLYYRVAFARTLRNVTEIWYNSKFTQQEILRLVPAASPITSRVIPPITEMPNLADTAPYQHPRPYFLFLGNIERRKGADLLLAAWRQYRCWGGKNDLIFAGLEREITLPNEHGLVRLGYVDDRTKFSLLRSARALVVPSRQEGYGMQVAEAAAWGVKTIAADLPAFREIDSTERMVFPVGDVDALARSLAKC